MPTLMPLGLAIVFICLYDSEEKVGAFVSLRKIAHDVEMERRILDHREQFAWRDGLVQEGFGANINRPDDIRRQWVILDGVLNMVEPRLPGLIARVPSEPDKRHDTHAVFIRRLDDVVEECGALVGAVTVHTDVSGVVV